MNSITQYISEKLRLNKDNKDLRPMDQVTEFIEGFKNTEEQRFVVRLLSFCVDALDRFSDDHKCYVFEKVGVDKEAIPSNKYFWSNNPKNNIYAVGKTINIAGKPYLVLYEVTKDTVIPENYMKKYVYD